MQLHGEHTQLGAAVSRRGRPRKDPARARVVKNGAHFTPAEDGRLRERARTLGITVAELLRASALGRPLPRRHQPDPIASDQWVELGRLAANLNQLQRAINRGQAEDVPVALVEELRCLLHEVRQALVGNAGAA